MCCARRPLAFLALGLLPFLLCLALRRQPCKGQRVQLRTSTAAAPRFDRVDSVVSEREPDGDKAEAAPLQPHTLATSADAGALPLTLTRGRSGAAVSIGEEDLAFAEVDAALQFDEAEELALIS